MDLNQFQQCYKFGNNNIIIDYLLGTYKVIEKDERLDRMYDSELEDKVESKLKQIKKISKPNKLSVTLIPSFKCNMKCIYCYEGDTIKEQKNITKKDIEPIINLIINFLKNKNINFIKFELLGGEPLIEEHVIWFKEFFKHFKNTDINYSISCTTNGLNIDKYLGFILEEKIESVQITVDGPEEVHNKRRKGNGKTGSFKKIIDNIIKLSSEGIKVYLRVNIDESNISSLYSLFLETHNKFNENVFPYLYPISFNGINNNEKYPTELELFKMVLNEFVKYPELSDYFDIDFHGIKFIKTIFKKKVFVPKLKFCGACTSQLVIDGNKDVYTCWWAAGKKQLKIGDIYGLNSIIDKWNERSTLTLTRCKTCKFRMICGGGCAYKAYINKGTPFVEQCADYNGIIQTYLDFIVRKREL